jgi:hypothetical protein
MRHERLSLAGLQEIAMSFAHPALVAKSDASENATYLLLTPDGKTVWVARPDAATPFDSMRDAARMAARLPASLRAFGLPRSTELALH